MGFPSVSVRSFRTKITPNNPNNKRNKNSSKSKKSRTSDVAPPLSPFKRSSRSSSAASSLRIRTSSLMSSLGSGALGRDGTVSFVPSPTARSSKSGAFSSIFSSSTFVSTTENVCYDGIQATNTTSITSSAKSRIIGRCCSFLRVADLEMDDESITTTSMSVTSEYSITNDKQEHAHRPVVNPPPGIEIDPKERWIAICTTSDHSKNCDDDENNNNDLSNNSSISEHTPIAPFAVERLANFGTTTTLNESMWHPDSKTEKLIKKAGGSDNEWIKYTFEQGKIKASTASLLSSKDVLVWSGSFKHGLYGSEVPAIRSVGIVDTSAKKLLELLVDSSRVKEYNKISLGRTDIITFDGNLDEEGPFGKSITKVMRSESKPPMMSPLALTSILHAKKISDGSGYLIVSRAVHRPEEEAVSSSIKTEIVMGVNLIVDFDDNDEDENSGKQRCLFINVSHMRSPMVPLYIAKRVAVTTAHKFINDIRSLV